MKKVIDKNRIASLAVFLIGILFVVYYIVCKERVEFDSDFTDTILWAEAMLTGNGIFDKTMFYAYTLPFGGSLIMMPFVFLFGVTYKAHVLGFLVFFAIFVCSLYKMLRNIGFSVNEALNSAGIILLMSLPTKNMRMIMWGHVIHYSLGLLFIVIAMSIYKHIDVEKTLFKIKKVQGNSDKEEKNTNNLIWILTLAVLTALFCTNGLTIILFFAIPFFGAILIERFINTEDELLCKSNINVLIITTICTLAGGMGFIISKILQRGVITVYEQLFKSILSWQQWIWDVEGILRCFLVCIAGEVSSDIPMESTTGIRIMFMAFTGFAIIIVPFISLKYIKKMNRMMRIYIISYFILLFASLFVYDFSSANGTPHRIVGLAMTAIVVSVIFMIWLLRDKKLFRYGLLIACIFSVASLFSAYCVVALNGENRYDRLANVLLENGLSQGYAEYWSAQVTTVLSDSKTEICPITVNEDGTVEPRYYNVRAKQFDDVDGVDKYFAFLSALEYETLSQNLRNDAVDTIEFDSDGYILVFDHNIF